MRTAHAYTYCVYYVYVYVNANGCQWIKKISLEMFGTGYRISSCSHNTKLHGCAEALLFHLLHTFMIVVCCSSFMAEILIKNRKFCDDAFDLQNKTCKPIH